jgi:O-antigen ligase
MIASNALARPTVEPAEVPSVWRATLGRAADLIGIALLVVLPWRIVFARGTSFDVFGLAIGAAGITAAWARRERLRVSFDAVIWTYAGLTALSTVVHHYQLVEGLPIAPWRPAILTLLLVFFFYGAASLLTTPQRVGAVFAGLFVASSILAVQVFFDHAQWGLTSRPLEYPSAAQWTGYADIALLFTIVLPFPIASLMTTLSPAVSAAAALLTAAFFLNIGFLFARAAYVASAASYAVLAALELITLKGFRLLVLGVLGIALAVAAVPNPRQSFEAVWSGKSFGEDYPTLYSSLFLSRIEIWRMASRVVREHPWLGVGPGNYTAVMRPRLTYNQPDTWSTHAHHMLLHTAAESGVPSAIAFLLIWYYALRWAFAACARDHIGMLAFGVVGALFAFFVRGLIDHFLIGFVTSDRVNFLLWTLFAAAVATAQMREKMPAPS